MNTSTTKQAKPSFYDICITHKFTSQKLQELATMSGVPYAVIVVMCDGKEAVARSDAEKVLKSFSQYTCSNWTLGNVDMLLLPTSERKGHYHEA